jgi:hypothetical protein
MWAVRLNWVLLARSEAAGSSARGEYKTALERDELRAEGLRGGRLVAAGGSPESAVEPVVNIADWQAGPRAAVAD